MTVSSLGISNIGMIPLREMVRGISPVFEFLPSEAVFTPACAIRTGSVFPGAPIVQGNYDGSGTPDVLSWSRGSQVSGFWYDVLDPNQGTICFWITPERDGDDGLDHYIYYNANVFRIYKTTADNLRMYMYMGGTYRLLDVDISSWSAGTKYSVIVRWDNKNTLDGTNYMCISINDTHSFGSTTGGVSRASTGTIYIGSTGAASPANAILEGFTIYRRVLSDGTYGTPEDGVTDELAAIYAAGAGVKPEEITSADLVFGFPTNGTPGELEDASTDNLWNWPWADNIPEHWMYEDEGYLGGPYAVFYNGSTSSIDCGNNAALDDLADNAFTPECWVRIDAAGEGGSFGYIIDKGDSSNKGWSLFTWDGYGICGRIQCATTDAVSRSGEGNFIPDGKWHHIAMYFDDAGDRKVYLAIDGVWITSYYSQTAGVGAIVSDVGENLYIGSNKNANYVSNGSIGWVRLSDNDRYSHGTDFIPPRTFPGVDGNTVEQWATNEGTGATLTASVTSPGCDGTITDGTWEAQWDQVGTPVIPYSVEFDGSSTRINCGSDASIDDLPSGALLCAEVWVRADGYGENNNGRIICKQSSGASGWKFNIASTYTSIRASMDCATTNAASIASAGFFPIDNKWHHVVMVYDDTGDKKIYLAVDGIWETSYQQQIAGVGAYVSDASYNLYIGNVATGDYTWDGAIGWGRLSNIARYTVGTDFIPPSRLNPPAVDGNTVAQWNFRDGPGTTLLDETANNNDGTITDGTWNIIPDIATDCPGERIYNWGYVIGQDAVDEGFCEALTGSAGDDLTCFPVIGYERDYQAKPYINVYDDTGAALIVKYPLPWLTGVHDGGNNQAALSDSTAPAWTASLVGGTVYNITDGSSATITATGTSVTGALAGGTDNDWDNGDVYRIVPPTNWVFTEEFCFELPAGCTDYTVSVLNDDDDGAMYVHQLQVLPNLVDNGGMEGTYAAGLAPGWTNQGVATVAESATAHSGAKAQSVTGGSTTQNAYQDVTVVSGKFYLVTGWMERSAGAGNVICELSGAAAETMQSTSATYEKHSRIVLASTTTLRIECYCDDGATTGLFDDIDVGLMDNVTISVTPASLANSTEDGGIRVDGLDTLTQAIPVGVLGPTSGHVRFYWTPRHGDGDMASFGETSPQICSIYDGAGNYFRVYWTSDTNIRLRWNDGGGAIQGNYDATGAIAAGTQYLIEIRYDAAGAYLYIDGVLRATAAGALDFGISIPDTFYAGTYWAGIQQGDAVFR